ncbi:hypothetical protein BKA57DRAFT_183563 [Linnemannia elongata]|nr:hypothetical protein BKA57DRAFT_183563 [Linnemannia elongata]
MATVLFKITLAATALLCLTAQVQGYSASCSPKGANGYDPSDLGYEPSKACCPAVFDRNGWCNLMDASQFGSFSACCRSKQFDISVRCDSDKSIC